MEWQSVINLANTLESWNSQLNRSVIVCNLTCLLKFLFGRILFRVQEKIHCLCIGLGPAANTSGSLPAEAPIVFDLEVAHAKVFLEIAECA